MILKSKVITLLLNLQKNYKGQANSHVSGTDFENGWYLPTISELYDIWKVKVTVDDKSYLCGGSQFSNVWWYLSSSQFPSSDYDVDVLDFSFGDWAFVKKNDNLIVCCIRVFN